MNRDEIIQEVVNDKAYLEYCKRACQGKDIYKDLYQYTILTVLEKPEEEIKDIYERGSLKPYISRIIWLSVNSPSSQFYAQNITAQGYEIQGDLEEDSEYGVFEEWAERFDRELEKECNRCITNGIYPAQIKIYQMWEELGSMKEVARCTQIPYNTIKRYVAETRKQIIEKINEDTDSNAS